MHLQNLTAVYCGLLALGLTCCGSPPKVETPPAETPQVEQFVETYPNGFAKLKGAKIDGKRSGHWESYYDNGYRWSEVEYFKGKREGPVISYYPNGMMRYQGRYSADRCVGIWLFYDTTGVLMQRVNMEEIEARSDTLNHGMNP